MGLGLIVPIIHFIKWKRKEGVTVSIRRSIDVFDKVLSKFEDILLAIGAVLVIAMMFLVSYGVIGRYFFSLPGAWTVEFSEYFMVYLTFFSAPWVLRNDGHVLVDVVTNAVGSRVRSVLNIIGLVIAAAACLLFFWFGLTATIDHYQRGIIFNNFIRVPKYLVLLPIPIGSLFLSLRVVRKLLNETQISSDQLQGRCL